MAAATSAMGQTLSRMVPPRTASFVATGLTPALRKMSVYPPLHKTQRRTQRKLSGRIGRILERAKGIRTLDPDLGPSLIRSANSKAPAGHVPHRLGPHYLVSS